MNKNLFNTTPDTAALDAEYKKYIDNAAHELLSKLPEDADSVTLETQAQEDARWGSWVVSASKRSFAFHQSCFAVNPSHTMGGVRPTVETAAIAVGRHIVLRLHEITKKVRPAYFRLAWVKNQSVLTTSDFLSVGDVNPVVESDTHFQTDNRQVAKQTALVFYRSYTLMGIQPPQLKLIGSDEDGKTIEEIPLTVHELEAEQTVLTQVDIRSESP